MLANVFTKTIRDRQVGTLIAAVGIGMIAVLGLAAYSDLDETIAELYSSLPEAFLAVLGLDVISGAGGLILGEIVNLMGPLVLAGVAISIGSSAIAGEERKGTFGVLLGNPRSRQQIVLSKAVAMVVLIAAAAALAGVMSVLVAEAFGTDTSVFDMTAGMVHVAVIALFFGFLALFIGSWTGNTGIASGVSAGYLLLSFAAHGCATPQRAKRKNAVIFLGMMVSLISLLCSHASNVPVARRVLLWPRGVGRHVFDPVPIRKREKNKKMLLRRRGRIL